MTDDRRLPEEPPVSADAPRSRMRRVGSRAYRSRAMRGGIAVGAIALVVGVAAYETTTRIARRDAASTAVAVVPNALDVAIRHQLGAPAPTAPSSTPSLGVNARVTPNGMAMRHGGLSVALDSTGAKGTWHHHANGSVRQTPYGTETVLVGFPKSETYLTVKRKQGFTTWRWALKTSSKPVLENGVVTIRGPTGWTITIPRPAILDTAGQQISVPGLAWGLRRESGSWYLTLPLDDANLPTPYVIDPAFIASSTVNSGNSGSTSVSATMPAGVVNGNLMVAHLALSSGTALTVSAAGWTQVGTTIVGTGISQYIFYRVAGAGEAGPYSFSWGTTKYSATLNIVAYSGTWSTANSTNAGTPVVDVATGLTGSSSSATTNTVNVSYPGSTLLGMFAFTSNTTFSAGGSQRASQTVGGSAPLTGAVYDTTQAAAGTSAAMSATLTQATAWAATQIAVKPGDTTAPTQTFDVSAATPAGSAYVGGTTLYYRGAAAGSLTLRSTATDDITGVKSVAFPALGGTTTGWTHTAATINAPGPYTSAYSWTAGTTSAPTAQVTATDTLLNAGTTTLTMANDSTIPSGGAILANGSASASITNQTSPTLAVTNYADAGSGIGTQTITRAYGATCATLSGSTAVTVVSGRDAATLAEGCYRYTLTATDNVGNTTSTTSATVTVDTTAATVTLAQASGQADPTKASPVLFTLSSSETLDATTVTAADFTVANGTPTVSGSGSSYTISVVPTGQGAVTIAPSGSFSVNDLAGNATTTAGGTDRSITYDTVAPTLTLQQGGAQADPTNSSSITFTLTANETLDAATCTSADFTIANGSITNVSCSGSTCTITVTAASQGDVTIGLAGGFTVADLAGNTATTAGGTDRTVTYDATAPQVALKQSSSQADPANASSIAFTFISTEALDAATVTPSDFTVTNGSTPTVTGSGTTFTVTTTASGQGAVTVAPSGTFSVADPAGNATTTTVVDVVAGVATLTGTADRSVTYDSIAATLTLQQAGSQGDPTNVSAIDFALSASETLDAATVTTADFTATGGSITKITCSGSTCTVTVTASGDGAVSLAPSGSFNVADPAGNQTTTAGGTDRTVTYDATLPTVTLQQATGQADPARTSPVLFTLSSSETLDAATVAVTDFTVTNGTPTLSGSGASFTISVAPSGQGPVTIAPSGSFAVADPAGNQTTTAGGTDRSITYDSVAPTLTIQQAADQVDPTSTSAIRFTITASEPLDATTITAADFTVANGGTPTISGSGTTFTVTTTASGQGAVTLGLSGSFSIGDPAGNQATTAGGTDRTVTYDSVAPTLTFQQAAGQADPANASPILFTLSSSEALDASTVTASDFAVANGTASVSGSGSTFTVSVVPSGQGAVTVALAGGFGVSDPAGNQTTTASGTDRTVTYDSVAPTVTFQQAAGQADPANASPILFTLSSS
ncbi:MAG: beta strand repeat-containing protein, partial [Gaiellales bacterium]